MATNFSEPSKGQSRVRAPFNPSGDVTVDSIKFQTANLIDNCEELLLVPAGEVDPEIRRLVALAQTAYEEAAMWAVKAATFGV